MIRVVDDIRATHLDDPNLVLTIGSFDGVHCGHRAILDTVVRRARAISGSSAVLTIKPHPREFFSPDHAPSLLTHSAKKLELFDAAGIDSMIFLRFNAAVAALEPEDFVREIIVERCGAKAVIVGHDFRFGKNARGDFALLSGLAPEHDFEVEQVPALLMDGERVSSTLIRERLLLGDVVKAEAFLGRPYSLVGEVVSGHHFGTTIGFPTANVKPHHSAIPAQGVYVCEAKLGDKRYPAAVNIGVAPTIRNEDLTIEAFLLNFSGSIEGAEIELTFRKRLRSEIKFPTVQDLIAQIQRDVEETRDYFSLTR